MAKIFISYRRDDSKWPARQIYEALVRVLPRKDVFMDIDSIRPGDDFVEILERWVNECDILLSLIGPGWIGSTDSKTGRRRLDNPNDFVRIEVRKALARGIPVVPVLLDGAPMPDVDELPEDMKKLVRRHAEFIDYRTFDADVERLIKKLELSRTAGRVRVDAPIVHNPHGNWFLPGNGRSEWFKDHADGPQMVVVPAGSFMMGSPENEPEREPW